MKRRIFLGLSALTAALFAPIVSRAVADVQTIPQLSSFDVSFPKGSGFMRVRGSTADLEVFYDAYMDTIWPGWKTHPDDNARKDRKKISVYELDSLLFACTPNTMVDASGNRVHFYIDACENACRKFAIPFNRNTALRASQIEFDANEVWR